jgi:hypothetical protein
MRISTVLAIAIAAPVLLVVTACGKDTAKVEPSLRGRVVEKKFEPAVYGYDDVPVTKKQCTKNRKTGKKKCTKVKTGKTRTEQYVIEGECYRLDIHVRTTDRVVEICDEAAFEALPVGDFYDSSKYNEVAR